MAQEITIGLVGTLVDDENWPENDETKSINERVSTTVTPQGGEIEMLNIDVCAGKEVRLVATVTAKLLGDKATARVHLLLRLYEGSGCNTTDPEGPDVSFSWNIGSDRTIKHEIKHPGDGGGSFHGYLHVSNRPV